MTVHKIATFTFCLVGLAAPTWAGELKATVELFPIPQGTSNPLAQVEPDAVAPVQLERTADGWKFLLPQPDLLFGSVLIKVQNYPDGYRFDPFEMQIPFYVRGDIDLTLLVTKVAADRGTVVSLVGDAKDLRVSIASLLRLYERGRAVTDLRLRDVESGVRPVHAYDLQSAFVLLQVARELNRRSYIVPDAFIVRTKDWLRVQVAANPQLVNSALGLAQANQLLSDLDGREGQFLQNLFEEVSALPDEEAARRCSLFRKFQTLLIELNADQIEPVKQTVFRLRGNVSSAVAQCLSGEAAAAIDALRAAADQAQMEAQLEAVRASARQIHAQINILTDLPMTSEGKPSREAERRTKELSATLKNIRLIPGL